MYYTQIPDDGYTKFLLCPSVTPHWHSKQLQDTNIQPKTLYIHWEHFKIINNPCYGHHLMSERLMAQAFLPISISWILCSCSILCPLLCSQEHLLLGLILPWWHSLHLWHGAASQLCSCCMAGREMESNGHTEWERLPVPQLLPPCRTQWVWRQLLPRLNLFCQRLVAVFQIQRRLWDMLEGLSPGQATTLSPPYTDMCLLPCHLSLSEEAGLEISITN